MRLTSKGQVTIPKALRERAGLHPGTEVEFGFEGDAVVIRPAAERGVELVEHLRGFRDEFSYTTEELMALTRGED